jgi:hypothetical protein
MRRPSTVAGASHSIVVARIVEMMFIVAVAISSKLEL